MPVLTYLAVWDASWQHWGREPSPVWQVVMGRESEIGHVDFGLALVKNMTD